VAEHDLFSTLLVVAFVLTPATIVATTFIAAPYGRHARPGWGPSIAPRLGWMVMESPSVLLFGLCFVVGSRAGELVPIVLFGLWLLHYVERAFVYPRRLRTDRPMPVVVVGTGFLFNLLNGYLNGRSLSEFGPVHPPGWLLSAPFVVGVALFIGGRALNRWADRVLADLRAPGETAYKIPRGGAYELVSCPNYLGEIVQWMGFALAAWSPAALAFALFTIANLAPRARAHHAWYRRTFSDYPRTRRAVIPFLL
jgi:hypothetical protein